MTPCIRTHPVHGRHAPGCTCTRECPDHDNHCAGCLPVEATKGLLCDTDSRRLRGYLGAEEGLDPDHPVHGLPWAWEHLEVAYPSLSQAPGGGGSSIEDAEAERLAAVVSLRDDIHDKLASWVDAVAERAGRTGPDVSVPLTVSALSLLTSTQRAQRFRISCWAGWLLDQIESLEAHPAVDEAWTELADLMSRAHALAPWRPAPTHIDGVPCRCGALALHDHGDEVKCWECRYVMDRKQYRGLTKVFARRYEDDPRGQRAIERPRMDHSAAGTGGRA